MRFTITNFAIVATLLVSLSVPVAGAEEPSGMEAPESVYAPVIDAYKQAYLSGEDILGNASLNEFAGAVGFGGMFPETDPYYAFYDFQGDGQAELLIGMDGGEDGARNIVQLFYYENGTIGKFFDETFNYRVIPHLGRDGTIMMVGPTFLVGMGSCVDIYDVQNSWSARQWTKGYFYDAVTASGSGSKQTGYLEDAQDMFDLYRESGYEELSLEQMQDVQSAYIESELDLSELEWHGLFEPLDQNGEEPATDLTEHEYRIYRAPMYGDLAQGTTLTIDSDGDQYILTVNLLEYWGTISGSYMQDAGYLSLHLANFSFSGWGEGDTTELRFIVNNDSFMLPMCYLNIDKGAVFTYDGSYMVIDDSGAAVVTGDDVRVRNGPGTDYTILFDLDKGESVTVTGRCGDWCQVEYAFDDGRLTVGYMSADYVEKN